MKTLTTTVARILFGIPFLVFSLGHLLNGNEMAGMIPFPGALILNYIAGLGLLLAAIAIFINKKAKLACLLLSLELLLFIVLLHIPKMMGIGDASMFCDSLDMMKQIGMVNTFKDLGLMAAALSFAGILNE
jgi:uncharacterized membrane protein YphA (DoxX/SURF4 family)